MNGSVEKEEIGTISSPIGTTDPNTGFVPINVTDSPTSLSLDASVEEAQISLIMFEFSSCLLADSAMNLVNDSSMLGLRSALEEFPLFRG
ncbi:hypothetical protein Tco_0138258 [Tanacetum coccineum]